MKKAIFMILAGVAVLVACKKDDQKTPQQKVLGKWSVVNWVKINTNYDGRDTTTYVGVAEDYMDFRSNDTLYYKVGNDITTMPYKVISNTQITFGKDTSTIKTLTNNSFVIYSSFLSARGITESTVTLKK